MAETSAIPLIVYSRHQEAVEIINSTLRNAGHPVHCAWVRDLAAFGDALAQGKAQLIFVCLPDAEDAAPVMELRDRQAAAMPVVLVRDTVSEDGLTRALELGARDVVSRTTLAMGTRPLETARWAGAVDAVGGDLLAWLTRTTNHWGGIASTGLTGGVELRTTVMPFILRGVALLGIDSALCPMEIRVEVWRRLATDMKPPQLASIGREIGLDGLPEAFETLINGNARGRFVVALDR